jgi:hypothetical protein
MASRTVTTLIDDVDGSDADETVRFSIDGTEYEIDLSEANAAKLRDGLAGYIGKARRIGGRRGRRSAAFDGGGHQGRSEVGRGEWHSDEQPRAHPG